MSQAGTTRPARILMLRHGSTESSEQGLFAGRAESDLTKRGREQARAWRSLFASLGPVEAYQSPLGRARQTAGAAGLDDVETMNDLVEWDLGDLEGQRASEIRAASPDWSLFRDGPPGESGEAPSEIELRARRVIEWSQTSQGAESTVVLVSHGQFLRALAMVTMGIPVSAGAAFSLGPCRAILFSRRENDRYSLTGWNAGPRASADDFLADRT